MFTQLWNGLRTFFHTRTPQEDYEAGRLYCENVLSREIPDEDTIEQLWAQSKTDRCFGGNGQFDRGISDVLKEHEYEDPEDTRW